MKKLFIFTFILFISISTQAQFQLQDTFPNLNFTQPVGIYHPTDGTDRLFVLEKGGTIQVFDNNRNTSVSKTFLDISGKVINSGEMGLLGLAFHPNYSSNRYFYVDYVTDNPRRTIIARYQVSASNPDSAIPGSEMILLTIEQPYVNHNGGQILFGKDGYLYIGMGDGGSGGDPNDNAQNLQVLLGKILRIDVDKTNGSQNYGIPADNPFYGNSQGYKEEIFTYGMRNPWRFSFDDVTGLLWCADVGQNAWEEIDLIEKGKNYGWRCYEGFHTYNQTNCNDTNYTFPVFEYNHDSGDCSITGGFVYRGKHRPELTGKYIYADYCSGNIWKFQLSDSSNSLINTASASIFSFGEDLYNELYICTSIGKIYGFVPAINAPSNLKTAPSDSGKVKLNWQDNSDNESGFYIQRKDSSNIFATIDSVSSNTKSYTDNLTTADNYTYRIIAFNDSAVSNYSNESSIIITSIPVELISLSASVEGSDVILKWRTATETNNKGFDIERLLTNKWEKIGYVAGSGTTLNYSSYQFKDNFDGQAFKGTAKYRLKQINYDGSFKYSFTVEVPLNFSAWEFEVSQNYPNPFNPNTIINYTLPKSDIVKIIIFNSLGEEIKTLLNQFQNSGNHSIKFDASNLNSGIYFYRIKTGKFSAVKKMVYLK